MVPEWSSHRPGRRCTSRAAEMHFQVEGQNLTNVVDVIDFGGLFSGNAIGPSRSVAFRLTPRTDQLVEVAKSPYWRIAARRVCTFCGTPHWALAVCVQPDLELNRVTAVKGLPQVVSNRNRRHGSQSLELKGTARESYRTLSNPRARAIADGFGIAEPHNSSNCNVTAGFGRCVARGSFRPPIHNSATRTGSPSHLAEIAPKMKPPTCAR